MPWKSQVVSLAGSGTVVAGGTLLAQAGPSLPTSGEAMTAFGLLAIVIGSVSSAAPYVLKFLDNRDARRERREARDFERDMAEVKAKLLDAREEIRHLNAKSAMINANRAGLEAETGARDGFHDLLERQGVLARPEGKPTAQPRILVIEDDPATVYGLSCLFTGRGFKVHHAATLADGLEKIRNRSYTWTILDLTLADGDGIEILKVIRDEKIRVKVAVTTGTDDARRLREVKEICPNCSLFIKPIPPHQLLSTITV